MEETHHPSKVALSGAIYTFALVIQKIISFAYFSIVAGVLGPERLGTYVFALSFAAFFSIVLDLGFVPMAIRIFSQDEKNQKKNFGIFFAIRIIMAFFSLAVLWIFALIIGYDSEILTLLGITSAIMVMDAFTAFFYTIFRARQKIIYESIGTVIFQIIVLVFGLIVISKTNNLMFLLMVIGIGSLWHFLYSGFLLIKKMRIPIVPIYSKDEIKIWIIRAIPFFMTAGFIKAYNTIDSILLKNISGDEAVGLYAIPAKIVFTFPFVALAVTAVIYPAMSNYAINSKERLQSIFERTYQFLFAVSAPICVGIFLLSEPIILRIWPEFKDSIPALKVLIWAVVFLYIEYPFGSLLNATGNEKRNTINRGLQLFVFIIFNLILIPKYSFMGAVYSALLCSILIVFLGWLKARKIIEIMGQKMILATMKIFIASIIMGVFVNFSIKEYSFLVVIPVAAILYAFILIILKLYGEEDWKWLKGVLLRKAVD